MRILVTGGRRYADRRAIREALAPYDADPPPTLVHGGAPGADTTAGLVAEFVLGWHIEAHPADWRQHGRGAGPIRNQRMADLGADVLIAFPGGRGTADMIRRATAAGIPVHHVHHETKETK